MNKDSLKMTDGRPRQLIAEPGTTRMWPTGLPVLVTHGTDTVVQTGLAVAAAACRRNRYEIQHVPVLFTGCHDAVRHRGFRRPAEPDGGAAGDAAAATRVSYLSFSW